MGRLTEGEISLIVLFKEIYQNLDTAKVEVKIHDIEVLSSKQYREYVISPQRTYTITFENHEYCESNKEQYSSYMCKCLR